jgi:hypothetical protein
MRTTKLAALLAALSAFTLLAAGGCKSDPHDTHIHTGVSVPR